MSTSSADDTYTPTPGESIKAHGLTQGEVDFCAKRAIEVKDRAYCSYSQLDHIFSPLNRGRPVFKFPSRMLYSPEGQQKLYWRQRGKFFLSSGNMRRTLRVGHCSRSWCEIWHYQGHSCGDKYTARQSSKSMRYVQAIHGGIL